MESGVVTENKLNKVNELIDEFLAKIKEMPQNSFVLQIHGRNGKVTGYKLEENAQIK